MKSLKKILLIIPVSLFISSLIQAQTVTGSKDSLTIRELNGQTGETQTQTNENNKIRNNIENASSAEGEIRATVKQISSARPDMSRVNGARSPSVIRPSGSSIPKGVGKPGGIKGPGGR